jgi:hypothetical protein
VTDEKITADGGDNNEEKSQAFGLGFVRNKTATRAIMLTQN